MRRLHSGQAIVASLALLAAMLGGFVLVFNAGQLVNDKMRLTNAADAAAFSAAQWQARALNYQSYLNRAIVANEVAIAQMVSLRAWSGYVGRVTSNIDEITRYVPYLNAPMRALERGWGAVDATLAGTLPGLEAYLSQTNTAMAALQAVAHQQGTLAPAAHVDDVLRAAEPRARLSDATRLLQARNASLWQHRFTERYERGGGDLRRFTRLLSDSRDRFTRSRGFTPFDVGVLSLEKRGGTDLLGEYTWRGIDTLSLHLDFWLFKDEVPLGWGAAQQRHARQVSRSRGEHGGSLSRNPSASQRAQRAIADSRHYQGVPQVRDVVNPASQRPRPLVYSVAAHLTADDLRTIDRLLMPAGFTTVEGGRESVAPAFAAGALHALASAEVYFQRPADRADGRAEYASLFNPYWQARLVPVAATDRQLVAGFRGLSVDPYAVLP